MKAIPLKINRFIFRLSAALPLLNLNLIFNTYSDQCEFICYTVVTRISAAALIKFFVPQMRRLSEGGAYLKLDAIKKSFLLI